MLQGPLITVTMSDAHDVPGEADQHRGGVSAGQEGLPHHRHQPEERGQGLPQAAGGDQGLVLSHPVHRLREQEEEEVLGERSHIPQPH